MGLNRLESFCKGRGRTVSAAGATSYCPCPIDIAFIRLWAQAMRLGALFYMPLVAADWVFLPLLSLKETEGLVELAAPSLAPAFDRQRLLASIGSSPLVSAAEARRWRQEPSRAVEEVSRRPGKLTRYSDQVGASFKTIKYIYLIL